MENHDPVQLPALLHFATVPVHLGAGACRVLSLRRACLYL